MPDDWMTEVERDSPIPEFITEVTSGGASTPSEDGRRTRRTLAIGILIGAMVVAGAWVALPGRSGAPKAPIPLPAYGESLPRQPLDITTGSTLPDDDLRLVVLGLQPGFSASDPEMLSIGTDRTDEGTLGAPMWWGVRFGEQPGVDDGLVTPALGSVLVASEGRVIARDVELVAPPRDLGPGISVLPGPDEETAWIVTSAGRSLRLVDVASGDELSEYVIERGRPLASGPAGVVLGPVGAGEPFEIWQPDRPGSPARALEGSTGGALLGLGGGRVIIAVDDTYLVFEIDPLGDPLGDSASGGSDGSDGDGPPLEPRAAVARTFDGVIESRVSPDGRYLAVGQLTEITEPDLVEVIDIDTGETIESFLPALNVGLAWIDGERLTYITPLQGRFQLVVATVGGDRDGDQDGDAQDGGDQDGDGQDGDDAGQASILIDVGDLNWLYQVVTTDDGAAGLSDG